MKKIEMQISYLEEIRNISLIMSNFLMIFI